MTRRHAVLVALVVGALGAVWVDAQQAPSYEELTLTLPRGDAAAGRMALTNLRCTACHRVTGDASLPPPVSEALGPELGPAVARQPPGQIGSSMLAPSHLISLDISPELKDRMRGATLSPMEYFTDTLTIRQLVDLVAYLRTLDAEP